MPDLLFSIPVGPDPDPDSAPSSEVAPTPEEPMWRPVEGNPNAISVNLGAAMVQPYPGLKPGWVMGREKGQVILELRDDGELYENGRKLVFYFPRRGRYELSGWQFWHEMLLTLHCGTHPNVKTALMANKHLIPKTGARDAEGRRRYIYFWERGFENNYGSYGVYMYCNDQGEWEESFRSLHLDTWNDRCPVLVREAV